MRTEDQYLDLLADHELLYRAQLADHRSWLLANYESWRRHHMTALLDAPRLGDVAFGEPATTAAGHPVLDIRNGDTIAAVYDLWAIRPGLRIEVVRWHMEHRFTLLEAGERVEISAPITDYDVARGLRNLAAYRAARSGGAAWMVSTETRYLGEGVA